MTLTKSFEIAGIQHHLELRTFADAKPHRIVLVIHSSEKHIYFWYGDVSTLKVFGRTIEDQHFSFNNSLSECKVSILKILTNS